MPLRLASLLLAAGPLAMLVVFGLVRDIPPGDCDTPVPAAVLDAYHAGLGWFTVAAEVSMLVVLAFALRAADGDLWRVRVAVMALALVAGVVVAAALTDFTPAATGIAVSAAVAGAVWLVLALYAGARVTPRATGAALLASVVLSGPALAVVLLLVFLATYTIVVVGLAAVAALAWLWTDEASPPDLVVIATAFALVVVPTAVAAVDWHGGGPEFC